MKIQIVTPAKEGTTLGNRITSERWSEMLIEMGHDVSVVCELDETTPTDLLIALHATRSRHAIQTWESLNPDKPLLVCLTGTDLHCDLTSDSNSEPYQLAARSLELADRIILLEPEGIKTLRDAKLRKSSMEKSTVIFQSSKRVEVIPEPPKDMFEVSLIGHLREVKDPFRAAAAAAKLPTDSRIQIVHIGSALSEEMKSKANELSASNPRYEWIGPLSHKETLARVVQSRLTLLTSRVEGAPGVISEAIVNGVPVLATRIPATLGLLSEGYSGFFDFGDTNELARLLLKAEREPPLLEKLKAELKTRESLFQHAAEVAAWRKLLAEMS